MKYAFLFFGFLAPFFASHALAAVNDSQQPIVCYDASTALTHAPKAAVRYDDLDLTTPTGAAELRARIDLVIVSMSDGDVVETTASPRLLEEHITAARLKGRTQADALISKAQRGASPS